MGLVGDTAFHCAFPAVLPLPLIYPLYVASLASEHFWMQPGLLVEGRGICRDGLEVVEGPGPPLSTLLFWSQEDSDVSAGNAVPHPPPRTLGSQLPFPEVLF